MSPDPVDGADSYRRRHHGASDEDCVDSIPMLYAWPSTSRVKVFVGFACVGAAAILAAIIADKRARSLTESGPGDSFGGASDELESCDEPPLLVTYLSTRNVRNQVVSGLSGFARGKEYELVFFVEESNGSIHETARCWFDYCEQDECEPLRCDSEAAWVLVDSHYYSHIQVPDTYDDRLLRPLVALSPRPIGEPNPYLTTVVFAAERLVPRHVLVRVYDKGRLRHLGAANAWDSVPENDAGCARSFRANVLLESTNETESRAQ